MQEQHAERPGPDPTSEERQAPVVNITRLPPREHAFLLTSSPLGPALGEERGNLPASFASFVGRQREIEAVGRLLESHRLVTLAGAPGVGKTRLALRLAEQLQERYADGIWLVELAGLFEPTLVAAATARALGIREEGRPPIEALRLDLRDRELLLILDNCEHLLDASAKVVEALLTSCPGLLILVTSRQPLGLTGEVAWRVPPLTLPGRLGATSAGTAETLSALRSSEAGQLFLERARAARVTFEPTDADAAAVDRDLSSGGRHSARARARGGARCPPCPAPDRRSSR